MIRKAWCIVEDANLTQQHLDDATWTYAKYLKSNDDADTTGVTLTNNGGGHYFLESNSFLDDVAFHVSVNGTVLEGVFTDPYSFTSEMYIRCDGWNTDTDPILSLTNVAGGTMSAPAEQKYAVEYLCLDDATRTVYTIGYWSTWNGWEQTIGTGVVIPDNSILIMSPYRNGDLATTVSAITPHILQLQPLTTGVDQSLVTLYVGDMTHEYGDATKFAFSADGVMKAINLYTVSMMSTATDQTVVDILNRLLQQTVDGSIVSVAPSTIDDITLYQYNDYPEFQLTLGPQWSIYLDGSYDIYFTASRTLTGSTPAIDVQGAVYSQGSAIVQIPLTVSHLSIDDGSYVWQVQLRKPDPNPVNIPQSVKIAAHGRLYIRPALKVVVTPTP